MDFASLVACVQASYAAVGRPGRVLLALSGGVDSVVLLHALVSLRKQEGFVLSAVHVHHGLRAEADADAEFVQALCAQLDVKIVVVRVQVGPGNLEAEARDARYRALHAQAQQEDADVIALAHHADDQVETILMHWMRGAGGQGLAGMRELSGNLWRPLLTLPRAHLENAAKEIGAAWCEDASNQDVTLMRNALRHRVLPELRAIWPGFETSVARAARLTAMDEDWAEHEAALWLEQHASQHPACLFVPVEACTQLMPSLQRRVLRRMCGHLGFVPDMDLTDRLMQLLQVPDGSINLLSGTRAVRTDIRLHFMPQHPVLLQPGYLHMEAQTAQVGTAQGRWQVFDLEGVSGAVLRLPQAGDYIAPLGMQGTQKLSKYLSGRGVDEPLRRHVPVLALGSDVRWAVGVGLSQYAAVSPATRNRVQLMYSGRLPWDTDRAVKEELLDG